MLTFALKTLVFDRGKLLIALVGVIFSHVLVNVQGGLFLGLIRKASLLVENNEADIWVGRRGVENVDFGYHLPEAWLNRIRALPGIDCAEPYIVGIGVMTLPDGGYEHVWVVGYKPDAEISGQWQFTRGSRRDLNRPEVISVDELDAWKLGYPAIGDVVEINGRRARVVANTKGALGFLVTPYLFTNFEAARTYCSVPSGYCTYFLVKVAPGTDLEAACAAIRRVLPETDVVRAEEFGRMSRAYWMARVGIGISFGASTALGLFVGLVMVAQSLYALTLDHLGDYAVLKAIGAEEKQIYGVVMMQALAIAVLGTISGIALAFLIATVADTPTAPIRIPLWLVSAGVVMNLVLCLVSSILPFRRIRRVDPATVLQGWA
jgi:putative ABC transport system permease protein